MTDNVIEMMTMDPDTDEAKAMALSLQEAVGYVTKDETTRDHWLAAMDNIDAILTHAQPELQFDLAVGVAAMMILCEAVNREAG